LTPERVDEPVVVHEPGRPGVRIAELQLGRGQGLEQAGVVLAQRLAQALQLPVRSQIRLWCVRAISFRPSTSPELPATGR
jgi:hypothetical protein